MILEDLRIRHHALLERVVRFDYRLCCQSGLHIGAGKSIDFAGSDLPVVRDASGRPYVPGSSLRGVLRAGLESFCRSLGLLELHRRTPEEPPAGVPDHLAHGWRDLDLIKRLFGTVIEEKRPTAGKPATSKVPISYGSRLQISDAVCVGDALFEVRDGVGIDRETRAAARSQGAKFDVEVVSAGTRFEGRIRLKNPADYELGLLAQALWMLGEGMLLLGGKSARGLGWVEVEVTAPTELNAAALLKGSRAVGEKEFNSVDVHLGPYLEHLRELADLAAASS